MGFDVIAVEEIRTEVMANRTRLDTLKTAVDRYGGVTNTLNSRLSGSWATTVKNGASRALGYLDAKVSTRANGAYYTNARGVKLDKLDNLNATVSSRAAQSTANDTLTRVKRIETASGTLTKVPTSGGGGLVHANLPVSVSGAGILRVLTPVASTQGNITLIIDGRTIFNAVMSYSSANLAGGGIRFSSSLSISVSGTAHVMYSYTRGD